MKVFVLFPKVEEGCAYLESTGFDDSVIHGLIDGEKIDSATKNSLVIKNKDANLPDLFGTGSSEFFISERFKKVLNSGCQDIEIVYLPFEICDERYYLLNIIGLRKALDFEKSSYTAFEDGFPDTIEKLSLVEESVKEVDIFRLYSKPHLVLVSEKLKQLLEEHQLTGFKFFKGENLEILQ